MDELNILKIAFIFSSNYHFNYHSIIFTGHQISQQHHTTYCCAAIQLPHQNRILP